MPEDKDLTPQQKAETPEEKAKREKGPITMFTEGSAVAEERARRDREREIERDKEQDADKKELVQTVVQSLTARAEAAEGQIKDLNSLNAALHKRYGTVIMLLVLAIVGLAGYRVAGNLLKGEVNIGGTHIEEASP